MGDYQYEIYKETVQSLSVEARGGRIEAFDRASETGAAVRVIKNGRIGFAYSTESNVDEGELIRQAESIASASEPDPDYSFSKPSKIPEFKSNKENFISMSEENKKILALELEASVYKHDKRITGVRKPVYHEEIKNVSIRNSNGVDIDYSAGVGLLRIIAVASENGVSELASIDEYTLDPKKLNPKTVGSEAASNAISYLGGKAVSSRKCACIIERRVTAHLLGTISSAFFADSVFLGRTPLAKQQGKKFYSEVVSIIDDAVMNGGFKTAPFDAEGSPAMETSLVCEGVITEFISDLRYSKKVKNAVPGGSVRGSVTQMPKIGVHNLYIRPGNKNFDQMVKDLGVGLVITDVMGLHMANSVTGDFSVGASGHWVEGGRIVHPVKSVTVAGNLHKIFGSVVAVGSDLKFWYSTGAPSLLIEEISVSG